MTIYRCFLNFVELNDPYTLIIANKVSISRDLVKNLVGCGCGIFPEISGHPITMW